MRPPYSLRPASHGDKGATLILDDELGGVAARTVRPELAARLQIALDAAVRLAQLEAAIAPTVPFNDGDWGRIILDRNYSRDHWNVVCLSRDGAVWTRPVSGFAVRGRVLTFARIHDTTPTWRVPGPTDDPNEMRAEQ